MIAWWKKRALEKVQVAPAQWTAAESLLPFLGHLDADERRRLRDLARALIAEKEWSGAQGLALTPEIQISIALQACLPILNLGLEHYRGWVGIVVYPGDFLVPRRIMDGAGVVHEFEETALGEAWDGGPVLVSWFDDAGTDGSAGTAPPRSQEPLAAPHGGALDALGRPCGATVAPPRSQEPLAAPHGGALDALGRPCGVNVVIHEFVHKLDMENGTVDGLPRLPADMSRQEWIDAFEPAYEDFCRRVDAADRHGRETLLDPYGAEHPAEFFAVMSEAFFETPILLRSEYPAVYDQLRRYYRQDPARQRSAT